MAGAERLKLHIKNNRAGEEVFRMTPERIALALARSPDIADRLDIVIDWDFDNFEESIADTHGLITWELPTENLIDRCRLDLLKPRAGLINMSRARVVDYDHLAKKLTEDSLAGAVLDVFDPEPLPADSPLWHVPNLIATPPPHTHLGRRRRFLHPPDSGPVPRQRPPSAAGPAAAQPGKLQIGVLRYSGGSP